MFVLALARVPALRQGHQVVHLCPPRRLCVVDRVRDRRRVFRHRLCVVVGPPFPLLLALLGHVSSHLLVVCRLVGVPLVPCIHLQYLCVFCAWLVDCTDNLGSCSPLLEHVETCITVVVAHCECERGVF